MPVRRPRRRRRGAPTPIFSATSWTVKPMNTFLCDRRRDGHGIRHHDRRVGTLFSEKPARRRADARSPCAGVRRAGEKGDARTGTDPRTEFRGDAERHFDGRSGRLGQPLGHAAARSACAGERAGRRAVRENERFVSGAGAFVPARRAGRGRLPELRLRAGAHQRTRRPLFADSRRFASGLFGPDGRLRTGADSGQHDRAGRGAARRRFGAVRLVGHRRHDQRHHQRNLRAIRRNWRIR